MDMIFPLVKTGAISDSTNLWLALPTGLLFGFALFKARFTDSRRIGWAFYFKDVGVPVVMFSAIVTAMLGLWGLSLVGVLDISKVYLLPTYLWPMVVAGLIFGVGMVVGGYCPGTALASMVTGKIDALVFVLGFFIGSLFFGDLFPVWGDFYNSDYRGVARLDQALEIDLGVAILGVVLIAVGGSLGMRWVQKKVWPEDGRASDEEIRTRLATLKLQGALIAVALLIGTVLAVFSTESFIDDRVEPPYYIVPKVAAQP
ncbi:MAG: YeeE/YedE thiosulfate transporter family protein [Xanthomonadales bacterium]|nr:YeeE/YedE thiosulfate transporter family protein [Xanthomonadales bacterium]